MGSTSPDSRLDTRPLQHAHLHPRLGSSFLAAAPQLRRTPLPNLTISNATSAKTKIATSLCHALIVKIFRFPKNVRATTHLNRDLVSPSKSLMINSRVA